MYPVSANFHTLAIQDAPKTRVRIYFIGDAVDCTDDNAVQTNGTLLIGKAGDTDSNGRIGQNGITFSEFFNPDKNIQVGAAVSSQIGMTLLNTDGALDNFQYGRCKVYLDVYDAANSSWLTCPMGVYIIDLPTKRKVQLVNATGYDQMQKLDEICDMWWAALNWSGGITLSQLLTSLATQIGVSVSSNTASAIVNGSVSFTEEPFQCVEVTYREVLEYIAEATGTVARFDRNGALDLRWFDQAATVDTETYTDSMVSFAGTSNTSVSSAVVPITPIQNLNGYDNPWPSGGGVSKCPSFANGTHTMTNGLTVTIQDGEITINGTASGSGYYEEAIESTVMPADAYVSFNNPAGTYNIAYVFINGNTQIAAPSTAPANATKKPTGLSGATVNRLRIFCNAGTYNNFKMAPIVHDGSTPQAWQPYANICPITGRSGLNVYVSPTEDIADATAYAEDWTLQAGTVYGGTVDVVSGALNARPYIASYTGETLVGPWVSSMDAYTPGGTPTTGAQVVDMGGTETETQLTPQQITALVGQNYVWASIGNTITVETATINPITIDTDTVGNQCLAISVAEYSVDAVDLLKVKLYTDDIGTTVGTGTNQYTIVNNLFLDGANSSAIIAKATPIYNRLHGLGAYSPVSARIITDWSIEAGDIINIVNDSTTYSVPIFQQSMAWRGGYVVSDLLSDGDNVRPVLDYDERTYYRLNSEMSKKVGDNEIISKINQSPESITIQANKVNLTGYVTFTNLSTDGQTSINGGNITTGTIDAGVVNVTNLDASNITSGTIDASDISVTNIDASNITTGTLSADFINGGQLKIGGVSNTRGLIVIYPSWANPGTRVGNIDAGNINLYAKASFTDSNNNTAEYYVKNSINATGYGATYEKTVNGTNKRIFALTSNFSNVDAPYGELRLANYSASNTNAVLTPNTASFSGNSHNITIDAGTDSKSTISLLTNVSETIDGTSRKKGIYLDTTGSTFDSVIDVTPRRCYATLSSQGWYRVFDYNAANEARVSGDVAFSIDITILDWARQYHKITLYGILGALKFGSELSVTQTSYIDKIRYWKNGTHGYIDVHYTGGESRYVACYFDVKCNYADNLNRFSSMTPTVVADSPSGSELTTYTFVENTGGKITFTPTSGSVYRACWYARIGNVCYLHVDMQGLTPSTNTKIFTLPVGFRPEYSTTIPGAGQESYGALASCSIQTDGSVYIYSQDHYAIVDGSFICLT